MMFQSYGLYPHYTVRNNIAFPLKTQRVPREKIEKQVEWASQLLGIGHLLDRRPRQLSGGERQRVALARALVREPTALLLDEPLSNLDAKLRTSARQEIKHFQQRVGLTTIYVTHDQVEAMGMGDRIAVIDHGKIRQVGTPTEIYNDPADLFVATFVGAPPMNIVTHNGGGYLGFRPENFLPKDMIEDGAATEFSFRVDRSEYLGSERIVYGVMEGFEFKAAHHREIAAGARRREKHSSRRVASLRREEQRVAAVRQERQSDHFALKGFSPMAVIAEPVAKPVSRFHFILDRRDVLETILVAPAIIYVLLLVGLPLLLAVYYSVSAYTIYDPTWKFVGLANFVDILQNPTFPKTLLNTFIFTFGSQLLGLVLGKFGAFLLLRPFPGRKIVRALIVLPFVIPVALATIAWRWIFDSLYSVINWTMIALGLIDRADAPNWLGDPTSGDDLHHHHQCLALLSVCHRDLPRRHHRGPAGRDRRGDGRWCRLLAAQLPDHPADDPADHDDRPDLRHRLHVHRSFHRLPADNGRSGWRNQCARLCRVSDRHRVRRRVARRGHLAVHAPGVAGGRRLNAPIYPSPGDLTCRALLASSLGEDLVFHSASHFSSSWPRFRSTGC